MRRDVCLSPLWIFSFAFLLLSCSDVSGGGEGGGAGNECSSPVDCEDDQECTTNQCSENGLCEYPAVPDGMKCDGGAYECLGGVCNKCVESDGSIRTCDDENECTFNECVSETGACATLPKDDGEPCTYNGGLGICVDRDCVETKTCMVDTDCDGQNDCMFRECDVNEGICQYRDCP